MNRFTKTKNKRAALKTFGVCVAIIVFISMVIYTPCLVAALFILGIFGVFVSLIFHMFKSEDRLP